MPKGGGRGGKRSHKGKTRHFTSPEELKEQSKKAEKEKEWRRQQGLPSESEESGDEDGAVAPRRDMPSDSDSDSDGDVEEKAKGVSHLIEVSNPNRASNINKTKKVTDLATEGPALSRKEREELQKQQAAAHYRKLHKEGKTDEARADLARLAIIRKQREDAAKKRAETEKEKSAATTAAEQKLLDRKKGARK